MALPILDGNQTSTTLATTVSGGAHYPNHIIASAVTISSLPAISGTVTANGGTKIGTTGNLNGIIALGIDDVGTANPIALDGNGNLVISGTVTANVFGTNISSGSPVPLPIASGEDSFQAGGARLGVQLLQTDGQAVGDGTGILPISGTITIGNSVTVSSLPVQLSTTTIGGTARLNVTLSSATTIGGTAPSYGNLYGGSDGTNLRAISVDTSGRTVVTGSVSVASTTVTVSAMPSGSLTTRFGSVTTANLSQITTCVTNTARKYLLCQNLDSSSVTIGIGFSPTTTQGVQLTAGAGLTFDAFCPTGAVWWLSAVTGASICILEG